MITELTDEALELGRTARRALEATGGDRLVRLAEADPSQRARLVEPVLGEIGAWDLEPHRGADELEAAAAVCRAAGWFATPYPVAERLSRPPDLDVDAAVVAGPRPAATLAGLELRVGAVALDGQWHVAVPRPTGTDGRGSAFVTHLDLTPAGAGSDAGVPLALALVLPCWTLLGMLDRALDLTRHHVRNRVQFGQPLAALQSVQFQLTDAEVERAGVEELAKYALWSVEARRADAVEDALALRLAALAAAATVFAVCHQLHGAIGFCDEATISWLSRHSQPIRRLPLGLSATRTELTRRLARHGLAGIFGEGSVR